MLDPADILPDREPLLGLRSVERPILGLAGEADEIPAGIDERVERVGLAPRLAAATRAVDQSPAIVAVERVAGKFEADVLGEYHRQLVARDPDRAACVAMDDRDRRAPITLARDAPVAQSILGLALAPASGLSALDDFGRRVGAGHSVEEARIDRDARAGLGLDQRRCGTCCIGGDHAADRKLVFGREFIVADVVRGDPEQGPGAIIHQHEIGDPHRQFARRVERVDDFQAGVIAKLFGSLDLGCRRPAGARLDQKVGDLGILRRERFGNRVARRQRDKARAEDGVRPGGEHLDIASAGAGDFARQPEAELQPLALADPILLHQPDLVGPVVEMA